MPSQNVKVIPPYAVLDPSFCAEWGRPLFAWHANSGRISVGNSGIAYSQGSVRGLRGLTGGTTVIRAQGGVSFPGSAGSLVDFGTAPALKLTTAYSMFVQAKPTNATTASIIMGCTGVSGQTGIGIGLGNTGLVIAACSTGTGARFISSQTYDTTVQTLGCTVIPGTAWAGVYRNGVALTNGTGQATPLVPVFSTNFVFSTAAQPFNGILYAAVMWGRPQPQRLFEILDADPGRLWWWPGKNHDRTYSIPSGSILNAAAALISASTLAATGLDIVLANAGLSAASVITAADNVIIGAASGLTGVGNFAATGLDIVLANAGLSAASVITAADNVIIGAASGLTGVGNFAASGIDIVPASSGMISASTLAASGLDLILGNAGLSGVGNLADSALVIVSGSLNLSGVGLLTSSGIIVGGGVITDSSGMFSVGVLSASGQVIIIGQASIAGASVISANENVIIGSGTALFGASSLNAAGISGIPQISTTIIIMGAGAFADRMIQGTSIDRDTSNIQPDKMLQGSYIDREADSSNIQMVTGSGRG